MKFDEKKLKVTPSSFLTAKRLEKALLNAIKGSDLQIGGVFDEGNILNSEISENTVGSIIKACLASITSSEVDEALFKCCERAVYGDEANLRKVNYDFFEDVCNRELYYSIMVEVAKTNISPFIAGLFSGFRDIKKKLGDILK